MKPTISAILSAHRDLGAAALALTLPTGRRGVRWKRTAATGMLAATLAACGGVDGPVSESGSADTAPISPVIALEKPVAPHTAAEPLTPLSASAVIQPGIVEFQSPTGLRTGALPAAARSTEP